MNSLCPLDHLYISQVKRSNFLYPLSIMTKRRRNCGDFVVSFFKILYDRGRNTCLYKGEMCFILLGGVLTSLFLYTGLVIMLHTLCLSLIYIYIYILWCMSSSPTLHVLFLFSLYAHASYYLYAIYYFCFTQRCLDEFCLKYFRNTGCQSLLAINSFLAKFFKSLCYDRFYCIQYVNMSWVILWLLSYFICLLWFFHELPKREIVKDIFYVIG